ncbi:MAG: malate dehydrogenase [Candidatus Latescibacterota bacterium]
MDISIIGASGACGREIVIQIVRDRLLERREILQLVASNPHSPHPFVLHGFRADLQDAYAETIPALDVTDDPAQIIGEVVVMAGGVTFDTDPRQVGAASRDALARQNRPVFERFARALGRTRGDNPPVVIVVTNPVELGVHLFAQHLPRENVIGMGAYSDSLRFRWEIAHDLGVGRQRVHAYVLGEHGSGMVPLWSSVRVQGLSPAEWRAAEKRLRRETDTRTFAARLQVERQRVVEMLTRDPHNGAGLALRLVAGLPPDLRVALKPFAIHFTDAKTVEATCHAVVELVTAIVSGRPMEIAAQYQHEGESGIHGPFGARLIVAGSVERLLPVEGYWREETDLLYESAESIQRKLAAWCA